MALNWEPRPKVVVVVGVDGVLERKLERLELRLDGGKLDGPVSIKVPVSARSTLFPTSMHVRFGEARARASFMKEGRVVNVLCEEMS